MKANTQRNNNIGQSKSTTQTKRAMTVKLKRSIKTGIKAGPSDRAGEAAEY